MVSKDGYGWIACVHFLVLYTMVAGVKCGFSEVLIPLRKEFPENMATLGRFWGILLLYILFIHTLIIYIDHKV